VCRWESGGRSAYTSARNERGRHTAVLSKIPHSNCCKRVPNRPLRPRRGRFGTFLELLQCGIFGRTAVHRNNNRAKNPSALTHA